MASGLGALIAQQKSNQAAEAGAPARSPESPAVVISPPTPGAIAGDTNQSKQENQSEPTRKANPFGRKATTGRESQEVAAPGTVQGTGPEVAVLASTPSQPATSRLAAISLGDNVQGTGHAGLEGLDLSDISLESLCEIESGPDDRPLVTRSQFADETPATKPTRTLPEDLDKQGKQFVELLDGMYEIIHDPELLGNIVKSMMIEFGANPQYERLIVPSDVRMVVRAARDSMGLARVKKTEAKAKRATGGGSRVSKTVDSDMMADLADLGIGGLE